ncbi:MAG: hypothetical protein M3R52_06850 [Acidobacteriota bacterium]|nr:hypothetical protein [Acidobacteriota bacterium]
MLQQVEKQPPLQTAPNVPGGTGSARIPRKKQVPETLQVGGAGGVGVGGGSPGLVQVDLQSAFSLAHS